MKISTTAAAAAMLAAGCAAQEPFGSDAVLQTERAPREPAEQGGPAALRSAMLDVHNRARRAAGVPALTWDTQLARAAQTYAEELGRRNYMRHSEPDTRPGQGENLWAGTAGAYGYAEMAGYWVDERRQFRRGTFPDVSTTGDWSDVGHYTQIIWRTTTRVGCGIASNDSADFLVCRYTPVGNVVGRDPLTG